MGTCQIKWCWPEEVAHHLLIRSTSSCCNTSRPGCFQDSRSQQDKKQLLLRGIPSFHDSRLVVFREIRMMSLYNLSEQIPSVGCVGLMVTGWNGPDGAIYFKWFRSAARIVLKCSTYCIRSMERTAAWLLLTVWHHIILSCVLRRLKRIWQDQEQGQGICMVAQEQWHDSASSFDSSLAKMRQVHVLFHICWCLYMLCPRSNLSGVPWREM